MTIEIVLVILAVLMVLDTWTTYKALTTNPDAREANPVIRWMIEKLGLSTGMLAKLAMSGGILFLLHGWMLALGHISVIVWIVIGLYAFVVYNNWKLIR